MAMRPNCELTVVRSPATSTSPLWRTECSAKALSLPELQETSALGFAGMRSSYPDVCARGQALALRLMAGGRDLLRRPRRALIGGRRHERIQDVARGGGGHAAHARAVRLVPGRQFRRGLRQD